MTPLLLCTSILVVTLTVSGIAKAKDPSSTVEGVLNLGLDSVVPLKFTAAVLPWAELLLAAGLLLAPGSLFSVFAVVSCALMVFYLVVIARALATGRTEGCNCFGKKSAAPVSRYTLIRNIVLTVAGILVVVSSFVGGKAVVYELVGLDGSGWLWAVGAALIALILWAVQRGESLADSASDSEIPEVILPSAADESEDYVRVPIPYASIYTADGRVTTLRDMSRVQARVLFFASPTCGSCTPILKTIPRWQKLLPQLGLHPVFSSEEKIRQAHKLEKLDEGVEALVDPKHAAMHNFGRGTPMAVILGSDGMLAGGPVAGTGDVKQLMDDLLVEFGAIKGSKTPQEAQPAQAAGSVSASGTSEQRASVQGGSLAQAPAAVDNISHGQVLRTAPKQRQNMPVSEQPTQPQAAVSESQNMPQPAQGVVSSARDSQPSAPVASTAHTAGESAQDTTVAPTTQKPHTTTEPLAQVGQQKASQSPQGGTGSAQLTQQNQLTRVQTTQPAHTPSQPADGVKAAKITNAARTYRLGMRQRAVRAKSSGASPVQVCSPTRIAGSPSASVGMRRKRYTPGASLLKSRRSPAELSVSQVSLRRPVQPSARAASAAMAKLGAQQTVQKVAAKK